MMQLYTLNDVEIFRTGTWKGNTFDERDLDRIVFNFETFRDSWFRPAIKDGHHTELGKPALGYVDRLWRDGSKLMANFVDMPEAVYNAIQNHGYDRVSIELVKEVKRHGKIYSSVLWALSLLGVEVPEVDGLKPLRDSIAYSEEGISVVDLTTFLNIDGEHFAVWTTAFINSLPDAAFAVIESGGKKDKEGKTAPRSLRHLPHHTASVKSPTENNTVDKSHLSNALSRLSQTDLSPELMSRARSHLQAHAKALGVGQSAKKETNQMSDKTKEEYEAKIAELTAQIEEANKKLSATAATGDKSELMKQINEYKATVETLSSSLKDVNEKMQAIKASEMSTRIDSKVKSLRLPALRPYIQEFYALACASEGTIKFAVGTEQKDVAREQVVDMFVERLNKATENLFSAQSSEPIFERDDVPPEENPRAEVDRRVKKYMVDKKVEDYKVALNAVFEADPDLRDRYNAS